MIGARVEDRARAAGAVGLYLKGQLFPNIPSVFPTDFPSQISFLFRPSWGGVKPTPLRRAIHSFLLADVPVQVPLPRASVWGFIGATLPIPELALKSAYKWKWALTSRETVRRFPLKKNPAAQNKVNLYLNEVCKDLAGVDSLSLSVGLQYLDWIRGRCVVYNDQASAYILYGYCLSRYNTDGWRFAAACLFAPDYVKGVSVFFKAVGANGTLDGALLTEGQVITGRGVSPISLSAEAARRVTAEAVDAEVVKYEEADLRREIRHVLMREIVAKGGSRVLEYPTLEDHWNSRWQWAVNGAHSGLIYKTNPALRPDKLPGVDRVHRRAWLETVSEDPRPAWDGQTYVSASPKLEHGKTRAIFACDTVNYLAFEHLMGTVEANWRGNRVILNPGKGGHLGMAQRVRGARSRSGVSLMLDYDDFNSQHSSLAMKILIEETCTITGYPPELAAKLITSFDRMDIYAEGEYQGRVRGTLMSGHRTTTYCNTVLNEVYLALEVGRANLDKYNSLHVGDDVYLGVASYQEAGYVLERVATSQLRMNPAKQSVGHVTTEFLRIASEARYSYGYLARAVASITSGNWVNELALAPLEALTNMVSSARSVANRSGVADAALLLVSSVRRMVGTGSLDDAHLRDLLTGRLALQNGPQFQSSGRYRQLMVGVASIKSDDHGYSSLPLEATHAYLTTRATPLETEVLTRGGVTVVEDMAQSSWSKTRPSVRPLSERLFVKDYIVKECIGVEWAEEVLRYRKNPGLLTKYPLIVLARHRLSDDILRYALGVAGGDPNTRFLEYDAFGEYRHGCVIDTVMSYTDAASLGARTAASVLTSVARMHV
nr:MAG: RNA-dependent RNA polymerase [Pericornia byssoides totivirus 1]